MTTKQRVLRGIYLYGPGDGPYCVGSYVLRYTSPTLGKRREMGLGPAYATKDSHPLNDAALDAAMKKAAAAWKLIRAGIDPLEVKEKI